MCTRPPFRNLNNGYKAATAVLLSAAVASVAQSKALRLITPAGADRSQEARCGLAVPQARQAKRRRKKVHGTHGCP